MKTKELVEIALFAAILGVLGFLPSIPLPFTPVPITLQNIGVLFAGMFLGVRAATSSMVLFVLLVIAGAPILGGGHGGAGAIFASVSGGFVLGWVAEAFVMSLILSLSKKTPLWLLIAAGLAGGVFVLYPIGTLWQAALMHISWWNAIAMSAVFIPGDVVKTVFVALLALRLRERIPGLHRASSQS
ncbi:biotin transporter BioY [Sporolactobacillus pectinivorans]|uniref:biotin transporter BioY n=1 Tax=Sporolactobacillus pectinivorans TaxID=1591408 RepID=UPI000C2576D1|nr:biotin transporter BioY [Sporolactobacillus pectinivorans]